MANDDIKNKNQDVDGFDFSDMDWEKAGDEAADTASKAAPLGDDDPFNSASGDDAFGGNDSFYSLEQMPDADGGQTNFGDVGSDDDAFGDIKTDGDARGYDFGSSDADLPPSKVITNSSSSYEDDGEVDPFASDTASYDNNDDGVTDPFATENPDEEELLIEEGAVAERGAGSSKFKMYMVSAAAVVVAAFSVVYVAPAYLGGNQPSEVVASAPIPDETPQFPSALPTMATAGTEVAEIAPSDPVVTSPVLVQPAAEAPVQTTDAPLTIPSLDPAPAVTTPVINEPSATLPVADPLPAAVADPLKDMVGGSDRGGIDAMKDKPVAADPVPAQSQDLASILSRLGSLEGKVDKLVESFDNHVELKTEPAPAAVARTEAQPIIQSADVVPPMKPLIIEGTSLKGIAGDLAWISTASGVVEVRIGDEVPKGGKVVAFKNYRGSWIVVTTDGLIVRQ